MQAVAQCLQAMSRESKAQAFGGRCLEAASCEEKKAGATRAPAVQLVVCPDKNRVKTTSRAAPRTNSQIANLGENARHLHAVELRQVGHDIGDERVFHQLADFFLPATFATGK
jgi:hypothetical protein